MRIAILSLALLATVGNAGADEEKVGLKELPKAVLAAVKAKFPEGKVTEASKEKEDGKTIYEVVVKDDDTVIDVAVSAKGKILEVEKTIAAKKLPKAVAEAIKAKYPKAEIKKAEQVVKFEEDEEEKFFEVLLSVEDQENFEVKLSPKGKILKDEDDKKEKKDKDDDDDDDEKEQKGKSKKKDKD